MLTSEAKKLLAETIRGTQQDPEKGLRARLLRAIRDEADRRYRLSVPMAQAGLDEGYAKRRGRIESYLDERTRASKAKTKAEQQAVRDRLLRQAEKEAAATLLNRLVLLRHLEAAGLSKPAVVTGGWNSRGYKEFREFAPALTADETEGYATLLQLVFDELAVDLPGVFGDVGLTRLFPVPAAMLREVVERLDDSDLASAWTDDTTFGWVYQYWNDPDREALDAKINGGGKIEPHEIASKTQMFTERYMVEWLLQNSLGLTWLCMCKRHGWTADAETVLPVLDARRADWRRKREAGEVALDALMPIHGELEEHWKYYVLQPLPDDAIAKAPESVRDLKILDPACGSGHFLVIAFGLLAALYREEARHRGQTVTDAEIAESILANNLYGIDIDPRAVQIAAAALYLKAKSYSKDARILQVNLVAPTLQLGNLPANDPAVVLLRKDLKDEVGIPEDLTNKLIGALAGVDYLGSLLKVDAAVDDAIRGVELEFERTRGQGDLFTGAFPAQQVKLTVEKAKTTVLDSLEGFLGRHSNSEDLGLRLDGEQLAAGVRFVRMVKEGTYDIVVGNPPYQGLSKTASFEYVSKTYPKGKADLYAAFLERGLQLVREGGISGLVTMRGWMFLGQFAELRKELLHSFNLSAIGDLGTGAFSSRSMDDVISTSLVVFQRVVPLGSSTGLQAGPIADPRRDAGKPARRAAALLVQDGSHSFDPRGFEVIEDEPIVYWWPRGLLSEYATTPKFADVAPVRQGMATTDNTRFVRKPWETHVHAVLALRYGTVQVDTLAAVNGKPWVPYIKGAAGACWIESMDDVVSWSRNGLQVKVCNDFRYGSFSRNIKNEAYYFRRGVAFSMIGSTFQARAHRYASIIGHMGSSAFPSSVADATCQMNSNRARFVLSSLNPGVHFEVGDVNRLPFAPVDGASEVFHQIERAFETEERSREASFEYRRPGSSAWPYAQDWAQRAVDRAPGEPLPPYEPVYEPPTPESFISFGLGVALGRFGANGEGILNEAPATSLPHGLLYVTSAIDEDSLKHPASKALLEAWDAHHAEACAGYEDLGDYLRRGFFLAVHKPMYENRPIYFPLSSSKKNFVAYASIHRWQADMLNVLLADHLVPTKRVLEGELEDLRAARAAGNNKGKAERRFTEVQKLLEELSDFIAKVTEVAENGPPKPDDKTPAREVNARFAMDLDDGVMVNSAALWTLLEPQWKDPKKWWKELATAAGKKDYDWSHLAARYFPTRVRAKCETDPSLAVAHGCFWELHPAKAYAWELRLQDEIKPEFTIDEPGSDAARARFLAEREQEAEAIFENERKRRERKAKKADEEDSGPLFESADDDGTEEAADA